MRSRGCRLCQQGAKLVLFITGRCPKACWYCPIARERKGTDVILANDREVTSPSEAIAEARLMSALGTSITGGEPLVVLDRVIEYTRSIKDSFGPDHHIHLYTGLAPDRDTLTALSGMVDEIRLHPPPEEWPVIRASRYLESVAVAKELGFSAGFEVPALRDVESLEVALPELDFLNVNELEWGEIGGDEMRKRGLQLADGLHNAVKNSTRWAQPLRHHKKVNFCPSRYKDSVQLRERLKRIAHNTARPFDEVTEDGTVMYGVVEVPTEGEDPRGKLKRGKFQDYGDHLELSWKYLKRNAEDLPGRKYIIERYPNRGIVVELIPL
ncbi:MAG: radical SAM protein [Methanomicrobiales archaeon]|nr:radical SAM protein [Methanomicrobiales archaeon]